MRKIAISFVTGVALVLFVAACGSSGSSKAEVKAGDSATTTTAGSGSGTGSESDAFKQLVANREKQALKVTYKTSGTGSDSSTVTIAQDGKGNSMYTSGDTTTYKQAGQPAVNCTGSGSSASCKQVPKIGGADPTVGYTGVFNAAATAVTNASGDSPFTDVSDETIAGRDAKCVTVSIVGTKTTICADKETGIFLKYEGSAAGKTVTFEATDVSEPSDSDFTPPVTPETTPDITLPNGVTLPNGLTLPNS
jgi:hypothetical protein